MNLPAGVSIINNNGVMSHDGLSSAVLSRALDSCQYDFAHNTTKAPILWAYDNMADVLNENATGSEDFIVCLFCIVCCLVLVNYYPFWNTYVLLACE